MFLFTFPAVLAIILPSVLVPHTYCRVFPFEQSFENTNKTDPSTIASKFQHGNESIMHHRSRRAADCVIPDNLAQKFRDLQAGGNTGNTFYLIPPAGQSIYGGAYPISGLEPYISNLYTDSSCPTSLPKSGNLQDRSTCPWYYVINHDQLRYPRDLAEARCRCSDKCVGDKSGLNLCHPVYYNFRVLRATACVNGLWQFEADWEYLSVGCTCAGRDFGNWWCKHHYNLMYLKNPFISCNITDQLLLSTYIECICVKL